MDKLDDEIKKWISFIHDLISNNYDVYVKGGSVTGLHVIKLLNSNQIDDFLIKDWDFTVFTDPKKYDDIITLAKLYDIYLEGKTIIVLRHINHIKINNETLFELSVKDKEHMSDLELPISTMKIKITQDNIDNLFELSKQFYLKNYTNTLDKIKHIDIIIPHCANGYFAITSDTFDAGNLSEHLIDIINLSTKNINKRQFLITHIKQPDRLFHRLNKNKIKSQYIEKLNMSQHDWVLNMQSVNKLIDKFLTLLQIKSTNTFNKYADKLNIEITEECVVNMFTELELVFIGCNINRLLGLYKTFSTESQVQIQMLMPIIHIETKYLYKMIQKKSVYKKLQNGGFYGLFRLFKNKYL